MKDKHGLVMNQDQSFDRIAGKFDKNIYGSTKGRLRHELLVHYLDELLDSKPQRIIDAGGGTGMMSLELSRRGHKVLLNDVSNDCLTLARQRLESLDVDYHQGPLQSLPDNWRPDGIVCHAVLEWLEKPYEAVEHLLDLLPEGGWLSLSFFNKDAHRFANLLYGNFEYIERDLKVKNRVRLNPNNALEPKAVLDFLAPKPVTIQHTAGIRCFHDYLKERDMQTERYDELKTMEIAYGRTHPYFWLGRYMHLFMKKQG
ncbi:Protein SmtA [Saliniradius amylolyticus]|uniref:tRNA 5-carboxymethoxyuridine methyltransferase n=1 Tax=Saliniradius amylolyticus TaxID=2183582 RepID=A0A2S2E2M3_9ALTE|nr:methyltransferase domain-containing protein [Saliniradius amylolyticus]AWL11839.1 Protein SmtA [Saliniradius amylolyticus]